jgi:hypothetical protein
MAISGKRTNSVERYIKPHMTRTYVKVTIRSMDACNMVKLFLEMPRHRTSGFSKMYGVAWKRDVT